MLFQNYWLADHQSQCPLNSCFSLLGVTERSLDLINAAIVPLGHI